MTLQERRLFSNDRSHIKELLVTDPSSPRVTALRGGRYLVLLLTLALLVLGTAGGHSSAAQGPVGAPAASPVASPTSVASVERASTWLLTQQGPDGGFVGFSGTSDPGATADAVIALAAARAVGADVDVPLEMALRYLDGQQASYAQTGPGQAAKLALAYLAGGRDLQDERLMDAIGLASASANPTNGLYGTGVFDHALVMLALAGSGQPVPEAAIAALGATQVEAGSWAFDGSTTPGAGDGNTTSLVIQALAAAGRGDDPIVAKAIEYLRSVQAPTGGFAFQRAEPLVPDANSTALALQAFVAVGGDPSAPAVGEAAAALAAFQNPSGAFRYTADQPDDNLFATLQAIPAAAGLPLPLVGGDDAGATPVASPAAFVASGVNIRSIGGSTDSWSAA